MIQILPTWSQVIHNFNPTQVSCHDPCGWADGPHWEGFADLPLSGHLHPRLCWSWWDTEVCIWSLILLSLLALMMKTSSQWHVYGQKYLMQRRLSGKKARGLKSVSVPGDTEHNTRVRLVETSHSSFQFSLHILGCKGSFKNLGSSFWFFKNFQCIVW